MREIVASMCFGVFVLGGVSVGEVARVGEMARV